MGLRLASQWAGLQSHATLYNILVSNVGPSPNQWVPGSGRRLPASLCDPEVDPAVAAHVVGDCSLWHRLRLEQACSEVFFKAANSSSLHRSVLVRLRLQFGPIAVGELMVYNRTRRLNGEPSSLLARSGQAPWPRCQWVPAHPRSHPPCYVRRPCCAERPGRKSRTRCARSSSVKTCAWLGSARS